MQFYGRKMLCLWLENGGQSIFARQIFSGVSVKQIDCCAGDCRRCDGDRRFIASVSTRKGKTAQSYIDETGAGAIPPPRRFCTLRGAAHQTCRPLAFLYSLLAAPLQNIHSVSVKIPFGLMLECSQGKAQFFISHAFQLGLLFRCVVGQQLGNRVLAPIVHAFAHSHCSFSNFDVYISKSGFTF